MTRRAISTRRTTPRTRCGAPSGAGTRASGGPRAVMATGRPSAACSPRATGRPRAGSTAAPAPGRAEPGSTDPRGASPPYARPLADRPEPEGVTLQVPGRSTMDRAYDAEASTDHRWIRAETAPAAGR